MNFMEGAGGVFGAPLKIEYQPSGTVVRQGSEPVCGPASCAMLLSDAAGAEVDFGNVLKQFSLRPTGVSSLEMSNMLKTNGLSNTVAIDATAVDLTTALAAGRPVIVGVRTSLGGHWIVVDSVAEVNGARYYMVRDPFVGAKGYLVDAVASKMNGNMIIPR
jgi:filamentous hemagglutinin